MPRSWTPAPFQSAVIIAIAQLGLAYGGAGIVDALGRARFPAQRGALSRRFHSTARLGIARGGLCPTAPSPALLMASGAMLATQGAQIGDGPSQLNQRTVHRPGHGQQTIARHLVLSIDGPCASSSAPKSPRSTME